MKGYAAALFLAATTVLAFAKEPSLMDQIQPRRCCIVFEALGVEEEPATAKGKKDSAVIVSEASVAP